MPQLGHAPDIARSGISVQWRALNNLKSRTMITTSSNVQTAARPLPPPGDPDLNPANGDVPENAANAQFSSHEATGDTAPQGSPTYPPLPLGAQALAWCLNDANILLAVGVALLSS